MIRPKVISLLELAELISAAFEEHPQDSIEDLRGCRLFRAVLTSRLKEQHGDDWVRAWNHVSARRDRG